jgi:prepilin-type N-terminal cleavage/methylation domain-containing protein
MGIILGKVRENSKGFTLLETLLVVAIIAIMAAIVLIAINPAKQLSDARNMQRQADVTTILNGVYKYSLDNNGASLDGITTIGTEICATDAPSCAGLIDLSVINAKYLTTVPKDPRCSTTCAVNGTGYRILRGTDGRVTVSAPAAEQDMTISVTR